MLDRPAGENPRCEQHDPQFSSKEVDPPDHEFEKQPPEGEPEEPLWSPPQFGISTILIGMVFWAALLALVHYGGVEAAFAVVTAGLICWLVISVIRLVRLSNRGRRQ